MSARPDPYRGFRFIVQIDSLLVAGFSSVSGLETRMDPETFVEGGRNDAPVKLPTRYEHPNLVFERGLSDHAGLFNWIDRARHGEVDRKNGHVLLLDERGAPSWGWRFEEAYPVRWAGPTLTAGQSSVAIETLELTHRGLSKVPGLPLGGELSEL